MFDKKTMKKSKTLKILKFKFLIIFITSIFSMNAEAAICRFNNPNLAFGIYDPRQGASNTSTATITVVCSDMKGDVPYSLSLVNAKQSLNMTKGGDVIQYQLFTSANYSTVWSDQNVISGVVANNAGNGSDTKTIYGKIISNQIGIKSGGYNSATDPVIINLRY
jgi:spore coat protein U-like protein